MKKDTRLNIRVTENEKETLQKIAKLKGYKELSEYLRELIFGKSKVDEVMLNSSHVANKTFALLVGFAKKNGMDQNEIRTALKQIDKFQNNKE
ncbi:hypothetical protein ACFL0U_03460 [Pseudomonadota bacterium]